MEPLARSLGKEGFSTFNLPYPSARMPIPALVRHVRVEMARLPQEQPVHFVTHSLGGIILRAMLAEDLPFRIGRIVMLAPPNGGSEIVDWAAGHPIIHRMLGPAGRSLGSEGFPKSLPDLPENSEVAVIMGNRSSLPYFSKLLENQNDGIVSASKGKIAGLRAFAVVHADHTFIQMHPEAVRLATGFLMHGEWPQEQPVSSGVG